MILEVLNGSQIVQKANRLDNFFVVMNTADIGGLGNFFNRNN